MLIVAVLTGRCFWLQKKRKKSLNRCFRQKKSARKVGEVCSVAVICNPQAVAMTENFSQQVSGLFPICNVTYRRAGPNGILEDPNLDAFQIWIQVGLVSDPHCCHPLHLRSVLLAEYFKFNRHTHMTLAVTNWKVY